MEMYRCNTCRGTGQRYAYYIEDNKTEYNPIPCTLCGETGYVDWIDNIKRNKDHGFFIESMFGSGLIFLPLIRHAYPTLLAKDLVSVQPIMIGS